MFHYPKYSGVKWDRLETKANTIPDKYLQYYVHTAMYRHRAPRVKLIGYLFIEWINNINTIALSLLSLHLGRHKAQEGQPDSEVPAEDRQLCLQPRLYFWYHEAQTTWKVDIVNIGPCRYILFCFCFVAMLNDDMMT